MAELPVAAVMGGGYAADIDDTVKIHLGTVATAAQRHLLARDLAQPKSSSAMTTPTLEPLPTPAPNRTDQP